MDSLWIPALYCWYKIWFCLFLTSTLFLGFIDENYFPYNLALCYKISLCFSTNFNTLLFFYFLNSASSSYFKLKYSSFRIDKLTSDLHCLYPLCSFRSSCFLFFSSSVFTRKWLTYRILLWFNASAIGIREIEGRDHPKALVTINMYAF